jgi:hypothetical protein
MTDAIYLGIQMKQSMCLQRATDPITMFDKFYGLVCNDVDKKREIAREERTERRRKKDAFRA